MQEQMPANYADAMIIPGVGEALVPHRLELPKLEAQDVLVKIDAVGVCGSDLFLQAGGFGPASLPRVPGHEACGTVEAIGAGVEGIAVGDQVALYYIQNAPDAPRPNLGPDVVRMGVDTHGAFSTRIVRPAQTLIRVSPALPPVELALLTDAVATPYHALSQIARLRAGERLAVIGVGGIGSNAIQIGRALGASVTAVSRDDAKSELARSLGADDYLTTSAAADAHASFDVVIQCAASARMDELAIDLATFAGRVVFVATTADSFTTRASALVWRELELRGSRGFTPNDIADVIELYRAGKIDLSRLSVRSRPLAEANEAFADLRAGRVLRSVLIP